MAFISSSIPNLINGISQQPPSLRRSSQAQAQENAYSSTVEGLVKRNPTEHIAELIGEDLTDVFVHVIDRDKFEKYIMLIYPDPGDGNGRIRIFDLDGTEKTVTYDAPVNYLDPQVSSYRDGLRALTIADYTFLVNSNVVTEMLPDTIPSRDPEAVVAIEAGNYGTNYEIYIDGSLVANYETPDGDVADHINAVQTDAIVDGLINGTTPNGSTSSAHLGQNTDFETQKIGSTIHIKRSNGGGFGISATDSQGDSNTNVVKQKVQQFSDLPVRAIENFTVQISGIENNEYAGYYVKYEKDRSTDGVWRETVRPGAQYKINSATMPHVVVREADGTFTYKEAEWGDREVGDEDSSPEPSVIGNAVNQMFFYQNRLGILSDDNVIFSRAGEFFQLFNETVTSLLDSGPIDIAASTTKVARLKHAVPWDERLLIFSDRSQFILEGDPILTPKTVTMNLATEFSASARAKPVVSGRNVYFGVERGEYGGVMEYYRDSNVGVLDAEDITSHAPKYVSSQIHAMASQPNEDLIVVAGDGEPDAVYVYKFLWQGNEKLQSSWSRWTFNGDRVLGIEFIKGTLYIVLKREAGVSLEALPLNKSVEGVLGSFLTHLDRKVTENECSRSYDPVANETTITLPYNLDPNRGFTVVERAESGNQTIPGRTPNIIRRPSANQVVVKEDFDKAFFAGEKYLMRYRFSTPYIKDPQTGQTRNTGRLNIRFWNLQYANTGFFKVLVTPDYAGTSEYVYNGRLVDQATNVLDEIALGSGTIKIPVMAKNDEVTIEIQSNGFLPAQFQSVQWEALYFSRSKQV